MKHFHYMLTAWTPYRRFSRIIIRQVKRAFGCPEPWGTLIHILKSNPRAAYLDVGAFDGSTIQRILDECTNPVHAFEPTPESFARLQVRYGKNPLVTLWNLALSDRNGPMEFHINANKQTNSLLPNDRGNEMFVGLDTRPEGIVRVESINLDHWVAAHLPANNFFVIKCDVQGAEGLVIAGGKDSIRNQCLAFYTEAQLEPMYKGQATFADINSELSKDSNLVLHEIYPCLHDVHGRALQTDALWIRTATNVERVRM
jgi:FkbM family methyltransferase